jgi:hypothetical protein
LLLYGVILPANTTLATRVSLFAAVWHRGQAFLHELTLIYEERFAAAFKGQKNDEETHVEPPVYLSSGAVGALLTVSSAWRGEMLMTKIAPSLASEHFRADFDLELVAKRGSMPILSGRETNVWRYSAKLLSGPDNTLTPIPDSYLGPIMCFAKARKSRIRLRDKLP